MKSKEIFTEESFRMFRQGAFRSGCHYVCPGGNYIQVKRIPNDCLFKGRVTLGSGVIIGESCTFEERVVAGSYVQSSAGVDFRGGLIVGRYFHAGPFNRFRRAFVAGRDVRLGNQCVIDTSINVEGRVSVASNVWMQIALKVKSGGTKGAILAPGGSIIHLGPSELSSFFNKGVTIARALQGLYFMASPTTDGRLVPASEWARAIGLRTTKNHLDYVLEVISREVPGFHVGA